MHISKPTAFYLPKAIQKFLQWRSRNRLFILTCNPLKNNALSIARFIATEILFFNVNAEIVCCFLNHFKIHFLEYRNEYVLKCQLLSSYISISSYKVKLWNKKARYLPIFHSLHSFISSVILFCIHFHMRRCARIMLL